MKAWLLFLGLGLAGWAFSQSRLPDTIKLQEAPATGVRADPSFREDELAIDSLKKRGITHLGELLRQRSSVFIKSYGTNGVATAGFRGTGAAHTKVYWNELDLGAPNLGLTDLSTVPISSTDQAQIQYGAAGLAAGSGALGGSIQLSNQAQFQKPTQLGLRQAVGSFGRQQSALNAHYGKNKWRFNSQIYWQKAQNNYPYPDITHPDRPERRLQNALYDQRGARQSIYRRFDSGGLLEAHGWYNQVKRQLPAPLTGNPEQYDSLTDKRTAVMLSYSQALRRGKWSVHSGLVAADNIFSNGRDSSSSSNSYWSWQNKGRLLQKWGDRWQLESTLEFRQVAAKSSSYAGHPRQTRSAGRARVKFQASDTWEWHALLREEYVDATWSPLLGSVGTQVHLAPGHTLRLHAARNFRYPSLNDRYWVPGGNLGLRPEKSWSYELGYTLKREDTEANSYYGEVGVNGFFNLVDNWIQWAPENGIWSPRNLKKVHNRGLEITHRGGNTGAVWRWNYWLQYSWIHSTAEESYSGTVPLGQQLSYVPRHKINGGVELGWKRWRLAYLHQHTDRYFTTAAGNTYMPAYGIGTASLGWSGPEKKWGTLDLFFKVQNLADWPYQILPFRPEAGRGWYLQLSYRWKP